MYECMCLYVYIVRPATMHEITEQICFHMIDIVVLEHAGKFDLTVWSQTSLRFGVKSGLVVV